MDMRNNLLSDLLRFVRPPQNYTGDLSDLYMHIQLEKHLERDLTCRLDLLQPQNHGVQNNPSELTSSLREQSPGMIDNTSVSHPQIFDWQNKQPETYLGVNDLSTAGNLSFVGTEIDQYLTKTSQMTVKDPVTVEEVVLLDESEDDLVLLENLEQSLGADNVSKGNEEVVAEEEPQEKRTVVENLEQPKLRKRYRSKNKSQAPVSLNLPNIESTLPCGQPIDDQVAETARRERISKKLKSLKQLIPDCNRKGTDRATTLDEVIKYVERLQKKFEFLSTKVDSETMYQCNLIDQICAIEQIGFVPVFRAVPMPTKKTNFPFILPATAHQILTGGQMDRQPFSHQLAPERTLPVPVPLQMPTPQQVPPPSSWDDDLQRLVNQALRSG